MTGYVQVYTGNGKGKSTAAFGLSMRAAGARLKVFIGQFLKLGTFSEHRSFEHFCRVDNGATVRLARIYFWAADGGRHQRSRVRIAGN